MRKKTLHQWIISLGAASSGIISSVLPLGQKACTGSCSACGAICIPGILLGSGLIVSFLYKRMKEWINGEPAREAFREQ